MRNTTFFLTAVVALAPAVFAEEHHHDAATAAGAATTTPPKPALIENLGGYHFPVSTTNADAQKWFDQGMILIYAFNHEEAIRSFQKAAELDPKLAMAHWGVALGLGPNYNIDVDAAREKQAAAEMATARELAKDAPPNERDYVEALSKRFSDEDKPDLKKLAADYAEAMRALAKKYPDDLDAATLLADAMMCQKPWALYANDYQPAEGTEEIVAALQSVLKRDPDHIGANHLYIHAVEASSHPERALEAAARLPTLAPAAGHLVHMPSHIYSRVGDFESAATSNEAAVAADRKYFEMLPDRVGGIYSMMYYPHNIHFLAYAECEQGNYANSIKWADELGKMAAPHVKDMPMLDAFVAVPIAIRVRFQKWDELLQQTESPDVKVMPITTALWHYARGMAYASRGDSDAATKERGAMTAIKESLPQETPYAMVNKAHNVLDIAQHTLDAKIAAKQKQYDDAAKHLSAAVELQDHLNYIEPPDWLASSRESLGGVLLAQGKFAEAEKVFREDLERNPRIGRALFGLHESLIGQDKQHEASLIERQLKAAWKDADTQLTADSL